MPKATAVKPQRRAAIYWAVGLGLTMSYVLLRGSDWRGSTDLHTFMEAVATLLAHIVGDEAHWICFTPIPNSTCFIIANPIL